MLRKVMNDFTFSDGKVVPKGCIIASPTYAVHHDNAIYSSPNTFDPFRFARPNRDGNGTREQLISISSDFMVFGHGRHSWYGHVRSCLYTCSLPVAVLIVQGGPSQHWYRRHCSPVLWHRTTWSSKTMHRDPWRLWSLGSSWLQIPLPGSWWGGDCESFEVSILALYTWLWVICTSLKLNFLENRIQLSYHRSNWCNPTEYAIMSDNLVVLV